MMWKDLQLVTKITAHTVKVFTKKTFGSREDNPISSALNPAKVWMEGLVIFPGFINLMSILVTARKMGEHLQANPELAEYIQLTRFIDKDNMDRVSCDWCSIVNGYHELLVDAIVGEKASAILKIQNIPYSLTKFSLLALSYFPHAAVSRPEPLSELEIEEFLSARKITYEADEKKAIYRFVQDLLACRRICAELESRWCPFAYLEELSYERSYWATDVGQIKELLASFGKVTCTSCVRDLNQLYTGNPAKESVFVAYLNQIQGYLDGLSSRPMSSWVAAQTA